MKKKLLKKYKKKAWIAKKVKEKKERKAFMLIAQAYFTAHNPENISMVDELIADRRQQAKEEEKEWDDFALEQWNNLEGWK